MAMKILRRVAGDKHTQTKRIRQRGVELRRVFVTER